LTQPIFYIFVVEHNKHTTLQTIMLTLIHDNYVQLFMNRYYILPHFVFSFPYVFKSNSVTASGVHQAADRTENQTQLPEHTSLTHAPEPPVLPVTASRLLPPGMHRPLLAELLFLVQRLLFALLEPSWKKASGVSL
jgi:hypothetical protein